MIPEFPEFKILELSDRRDVEKFTLKYPPYSDFNFLGTWSWDVRDQMKISRLNDNYVIRFVSYLTGKPFYTFLGNNQVNDTVKKLLDLSVKEKLAPELKLISEESIRGLDLSLFKIEEDRDNFDYVYDLEELKDYKGKKFEKKRSEVKNFLKNYSKIETKPLDLGDKNIQEKIVKIYQKWAKYRIEENREKNIDFDPHHELVVIKKLFSVCKEFSLVSVGIFVKNDLAAFCIDELMESEYAVSHVAKTDPSFSGINSFLMQKSAEILYSYGKRYFDYEQDLGLSNLRLGKTLFRPCFLLKKYNLSPWC